MKRFEHYILRVVPDNFTGETFGECSIWSVSSKLDELGEKGFELVAIDTTSNSKYSFYIFKREYFAE